MTEFLMVDGIRCGSEVLGTYCWVAYGLWRCRSMHSLVLGGLLPGIFGF